MNVVGAMQMPGDFPYREVFLKGKPQHESQDQFCRRHPRMELGHRAKIFSPFDALKGLHEAALAKQTHYCSRVALNEEAERELNRRLEILKVLTRNRHMAKENSVQVTVVFYVPCMDVHHEAYGSKGEYRKIIGICQKVDEQQRSITIGETVILFEDLLFLENDSGIFSEISVFD